MFVDEQGFRYRRLEPDVELAVRERIMLDPLARLCACMGARQAAVAFDAMEKEKEGAGGKGKTAANSAEGSQNSACDCDCQFWEVL